MTRVVLFPWCFIDLIALLHISCSTGRAVATPAGPATLRQQVNRVGNVIKLSLCHVMSERHISIRFFNLMEDLQQSRRVVSRVSPLVLFHRNSKCRIVDCKRMGAKILTVVVEGNRIKGGDFEFFVVPGCLFYTLVLSVLLLIMLS